MTHRGPFQPLLFCDSVILSYRRSPSAVGMRPSPFATPRNAGSSKEKSCAVRTVRSHFQNVNSCQGKR